METRELSQDLPPRWTALTGLSLEAIKDTLEQAYNTPIRLPALGQHPLRSDEGLMISMAQMRDQITDLPKAITEEHLRRALYAYATAMELIQDRLHATPDIDVFDVTPEPFKDSGPTSGALYYLRGPEYAQEHVAAVNPYGFGVQPEIFAEPEDAASIYEDQEANNLTELTVRVLGLSLVIPSFHRLMHEERARDVLLQAAKVVLEHAPELTRTAVTSPPDLLGDVFVRLVKDLPVPAPILEVYQELGGITA